MNKIKYFVNYEGREDCYYIVASSTYSLFMYGDYLKNGFIYDKENVFDTLEEARKSLDYTSKRIIEVI